MDKVHKVNDSKCDIPSSESYTHEHYIEAGI